MNEKLAKRVALLREWLPDASSEERLEIFRAVMAGYCTECGSAHLPCYCTRDD